MKLESVLKNIEVKNKISNLSLDINKMEHDSRKIEKGDMFIAIKGYTVDGNEFIDSAIKKGAVCVMTETDIKRDDIEVIVVEDIIKEMAKAASNLYENPSSKLNLIGITGTNGKSTTSYILKSIVEKMNQKVGVIGTIGYAFEGEIKKVVGNTTPNSVELQAVFNELLSKGAESCIMEVSSHSLKLGRVNECDFDVSIFTNLTPEHLDFHKTIEDYFETKAKLFYRSKGKNAINLDDEYGKKLVEKLKKDKIDFMTFAIDSDADVRAENISNEVTGVEFDLIYKGEKEKIHMSIPGRFSVYNALSAATAALLMGADLQVIKEGIKAVEGVRGRFERVPINRDYHVIIDYAHTPDGYENIFKTVNEFAKARKITVFGCGGDRDSSNRSVMGRIAAENSDLCMLTTDNPRTENPDNIMSNILDGVNAVNGKYEIVIDREEAIKRAMDIAKKDDIILLIGKGHETYQIIGHEKIHFSEREIVLEYGNK